MHTDNVQANTMNTAPIPPTFSTSCLFHEIIWMVLPPGGWYEVLSMQLTKTTSFLETLLNFILKTYNRKSK